jgi:hypothetical protein
MMTTLDDNYTTSDLGCTTALVTCGHQVKSLDKSNPSRVVFIFHKTDELIKCTEAYWSGLLKVDAKTYFETQKWLKSRIYNG